MVDVAELEQFLLNRNVSLDVRIRRLITCQGVKIATLAYLGEVLRDHITKEEKGRYKIQVERLIRSVEIWRSRVSSNN